MIKLRFFPFGVALCLALVFNFAVSAQTTIFNVPSTDVTPEKSVYMEADFTAHFDKFEKGGFQTIGYKTVYGLRRNVEVGVNFFLTRNGFTSPKEFQANAKWKAYQNEKRGLAVTTGAQMFVPLNRSAGRRTVGMFYANASKVFRPARGLRLTGGAYTIVGATREFGNRKGFMLGLEQPVRRRLSFVSDWYSGKNRFGYASAGFSYALTKRQILYAGYNFGNAGRGNNSLSVFYGFTY